MLDDNDRILIDLTAKATVSEAVKEILPIVDHKITEHVTSCQLTQTTLLLEKARKKQDRQEKQEDLGEMQNEEYKSNSSKILNFALKHWAITLVVGLLLWNRVFPQKPVTIEEVKLTTQQAKQLAQEIMKLSITVEEPNK